MSIYAVNHLCREVLRDRAFRQAMRDDPAAALAPLDLSEEERAALLAGDVAALYRMGANAFLLLNLGRFETVGLDIATYTTRIAAAAAER